LRSTQKKKKKYNIHVLMQNNHFRGLICASRNYKNAFAVFNRSRRTPKENWKIRIARKNLWRKSMFRFDVATSTLLM